MEALREKLRGLGEQLASSQSEVEELKEQMRLGVLSVVLLDAEGDTTVAVAGTGGGSGAAQEGVKQEAQQLRARVTELEEELAKRQGGDTVKQLTEKVKELQAALTKKESMKGDGEKDAEGGEGEIKCLRDKVAELEKALAESRASGREKGGAGHIESDLVRRLQERMGELEGELRRCVPRSELEEVQVTLGLQCEQLARERADVARRLNDALIELERLRPPHGEEEEEEEEEHSESSEPSFTSGV